MCYNGSITLLWRSKQTPPSTLKGGLMMKKFFVILAVLTLLVQTIPAAASTAENEIDLFLTDAAANGIIESQTVEEFNPSKECTAGFFAKLLYNAAVNRKEHFAEAKYHTTKRAMNWLRDAYISAALREPTSATRLLYDFTDRRLEDFKSSNKVSYQWVEVAVTIVKYGHYDEVFQDYLREDIMAAKDYWSSYKKGKKITRLEALQIVMDNFVITEVVG